MPGGEEGDAVHEGGGPGPAGGPVAGAVGEHGGEQTGEGDGPGGADGEPAFAAQQGAQRGEDDADEDEAADGPRPAGADAEEVERPGRPGGELRAGFGEEGGGAGEQVQ